MLLMKSYSMTEIQIQKETVRKPSLQFQNGYEKGQEDMLRKVKEYFDAKASSSPTKTSRLSILLDGLLARISQK